jgi:hypothetical protein
MEAVRVKFVAANNSNTFIDRSTSLLWNTYIKVLCYSWMWQRQTYASEFLPQNTNGSNEVTKSWDVGKAETPESKVTRKKEW